MTPLFVVRISVLLNIDWSMGSLFLGHNNKTCKLVFTINFSSTHNYNYITILLFFCLFLYFIKKSICTSICWHILVFTIIMLGIILKGIRSNPIYLTESKLHISGNFMWKEKKEETINKIKLFFNYVFTIWKK